MLICVFKKSLQTGIQLCKWLVIPSSRSSINLAHESLVQQKSPKLPWIGWSLRQDSCWKCLTIISYGCSQLSLVRPPATGWWQESQDAPPQPSETCVLPWLPLAHGEEASSHVEVSCSVERPTWQGAEASVPWSSRDWLLPTTTGKPTPGEPWKDTLIASY